MPLHTGAAFLHTKGKNMADELTTLLPRREVERLTGFGRSALYARMDPRRPEYDPTFPKPVPMGTQAVRWVASEVQAWIHARIAERDNRLAA
jgi:prophage regulatory protein